MNTTEAPQEVRRLVGGRELLSKAAVPVGVTPDGRVTTYLGEFTLNVSRLLRRIEEEARRAALSPRVWENDVLFLSNDAYRPEHDRLLSENGNYGLRKNQIRFFHQPLGFKFVATPEDVTRLRPTFRSEEAYRQALAFSESVGEKIKSGHHRSVVLENEKDPQGHGEYFHQLIASGEFLRWAERGKKWVFVKNVDNSAAKLDGFWLRLLGRFLEEKLDMQPEVSPRAPGRKGGSLIVRLDNATHELVEDPNIEATNEVRAKKGEKPVMNPTDSYWFNNAVAIFSLDYVADLYKEEGQTKDAFIKELKKADENGRQAIAERGRRRFPSILDAKPARTPPAVAVKKETNLWQSTGLVGPERQVLAIGVRGAMNLDWEAYRHMDRDRKFGELAKMRFLSTKNWTKSGPEIAQTRESLEKLLGRSVSEEELALSLETYEGNKPLAEDLLRYNREAELVPHGIFH
jgi:hypothetical protein